VDKFWVDFFIFHSPQEKQIPFGNDNQKNNSKNRSRSFPFDTLRVRMIMKKKGCLSAALGVCGEVLLDHF
jgi:hypothetical protein